MKYWIAGIIVLLASNTGASESVTKTDTWVEEYTVTTTTPRLHIKNIWGSVRVIPGDDGQIVVAARERRTAPDELLFERSLEALPLLIDSRDEGVSMMVGRRDEQQGSRWHVVNPCPGCRVDYEFDVHVPAGTVVDVGTVMDGNVEIEGVTGPVSASNVNGSVSISDVQACESVSSINGDIDVDFIEIPDTDCHLETLNGDVVLAFPDGANLDVKLAFSRPQARMVSDFELTPISMPARIEYIRQDRGSRYRIEKPQAVRIGAGGPSFTISSLNGDVRLRKNQ